MICKDKRDMVKAPEAKLGLKKLRREVAQLVSGICLDFSVFWYFNGYKDCK